MNSYEYRYVAWWNAYLYPGLRAQDFARPSGTIIYHEQMDYHYRNLQPKTPAAIPDNSIAPWPPNQPTLLGICADGHVQKWVVQYQQYNDSTARYDANWFYYDQNNLASQSDVKLGWDIQ